MKFRAAKVREVSDNEREFLRKGVRHHCDLLNETEELHYEELERWQEESHQCSQLQEQN